MHGRVVTCPNCGVVFAITLDFESQRWRDECAFYCPNGCALRYHRETSATTNAEAGSGEREHLRRELTQAQDRLAVLEQRERVQRDHLLRLVDVMCDDCVRRAGRA